MTSQTLLRVLHLGLRVLEAFLARRPPKPRPPTRADKIVERVAPLAERILERVQPAAQPQVAAPPRRSWGLLFARTALVSAVVAGGTAYLIMKQRRRVRGRYRRLAARFPEELLDVLAAPGGGGRLELVYDGNGLHDPQTGLLYPVIDGIPDFIASPLTEAAYLAGAPAPDGGDDLKLGELFEPVQSSALGENRVGDAVLAGAVASFARTGWALSLPCNLRGCEIEMARANPQARLLCVTDQWDALLEARRKAREARIGNLYFTRGDPTLLPVQDQAMDSLWTANGLHSYRRPEGMITQMARATRQGALMAGVALMLGGPRYYDALLGLHPRLPGRREAQTYFSLLSAAGFDNLHAFREGAYVRFVGVKE